MISHSAKFQLKISGTWLKSTKLTPHIVDIRSHAVCNSSIYPEFTEAVSLYPIEGVSDALMVFIAGSSVHAKPEIPKAPLRPDLAALFHDACYEL